MERPRRATSSSGKKRRPSFNLYWDIAAQRHHSDSEDEGEAGEEAWPKGKRGWVPPITCLLLPAAPASCRQPLIAAAGLPVHRLQVQPKVLHLRQLPRTTAATRQCRRQSRL
jgi:hypothetical protein